MPDQISLRGKVRLSHSLSPLANVKIEAWSPDSYGLVAGGYTTPEGKFLLNVAGGAAVAISEGTATLAFKIYQNDTLLLETTEDYTTEEITLEVSEGVFDADADDNVPVEPIVNYLLLKGTLCDELTGAIMPNIKVNIYDQNFREKTLAGFVVTDILGQFQYKVSTKTISSAKVIASRSIRVEAVTSSGDLLAHSTISEWSDVMTVDLKARNYAGISTEEYDNLVPSEFDSVKTAINYVIEAADIATIGNADDSDNTNEIAYIANATGMPEDKVRNVVSAYKNSLAVEAVLEGGVTVDKNFMYAITKESNSSENPVLKLMAPQISAQITNAIDQKIIPAYNPATLESDIAGFVSSVKVYQREQTKALPINNESYTLNDVLTSVFSAGDPGSVQNDINTFLTAYNAEEFANVDEFWSDFASTSPDLATKGKMGLQLAAIAGFQKEIVSNLMTATYENTDPNYNNSDIKKLATWDEATWVSSITAACVTADRLCVPFGIRGDVSDHSSSDGEQAIEAYARKMKAMVQEMYPLTTVKYTLENSGGAAIIEDTTRRTQVISFLADNPDIDLRNTRVHDINDVDFDLTNVENEEELKADLEPFQRLMMVAGGKPEAISTMIADGVNSAASIAAMSEENFVTSYGAALGGEQTAKVAYTNATLIYGSTVLTLSGNLPSTGTFTVMGRPWRIPTPPPSADPDLATLFGNQNYCGCEYCTSMYSPSAYLVDILNFLKNSGSSPSVFNELIRRRSDLQHIDLTCKNTNTSIPYIDIVNELLERRILDDVSGVTPPDSFQTHGKAKDLAAHPEHIEKDGSGNYVDYRDYRLVYDDDASIGHEAPLNKASAVYPGKLPFNLALEESRTYMQHLGISRYELMRLFKPYSSAPSNGITDYELASEWLGLTTASSDTAANIITGDHTNTSSPWLFYGVAGATSGTILDPANSGATIAVNTGNPWNVCLTSRIDVLIQQAKITYSELLQLLTTDFLNKADGSGNRKIAIVVTSSSVPEDTCALNELKLEFTSPETSSSFLGKLHRFIRLWRSSKMTIYQLDTVLRSLDDTILDSAGFVLLGRVLSVASELKISPELLATWWTNLDTHNYKNYKTDSRPEVIPSVFQSVFSNRAVLNLPVEAFEDPAGLPTEYSDNTALIAAAARIKEDEVFAILSYLQLAMSDDITLKVLSTICAVGELSRALNRSVKEVLALFEVMTFDIAKLKADNNLGTDDTMLEYLEELLRVDRLMKVSGFNVSDLQYLCRGIDGDGTSTPDKSAIQLFFENVRAELKKSRSVSDADITPLDISGKLTNRINQALAKEFNTTTEWVIAISENLALSGTSGNMIEWMAGSDFISSDDELDESAIIGGNDIAELYAHYRYMDRVISLTQRLGLKYKEFVFFSENNSIIDFDFFALSTVEGISNSGAKALFYKILRLGSWIEVRRRLSIKEEDFIALLTAADGGTIPDKEAWSNILERNTHWGSFLAELTGAPDSLTDKGLLLADFASDYAPSVDKAPEILLKVIEIVGWCYRTGLNPATIYNMLKSDLVLNDSNKILLAAKGKQDDSTWLKIARPLRDELRKKQRDALVAYLLANPATGNHEYWKNENELFEYFLIDVEMEPCMLTSRIKQAIASIQIFVDRVMMGYEYFNNQYNVSAQKLSLSKDSCEEWKKWRKWYRVWEANRKVFLYPENWLEPELRDDKSVFFEEFEAEMQQDEVTDQLAEDALVHYLQKLDEVARLEPVSCCEKNGVIHVFARTYSEPHKYFYRRLIGDAWTPWEPMEIEIKSDHIIPAVSDRRLRLYWLSFRERAQKFYLAGWHTQAQRDDIKKNGYNYGASPWFHNNDFKEFAGGGAIPLSDEPDQKIIDVTLNWSEYKNGKWLKQSVSKESIPLLLNPTIDNHLGHYLREYRDNKNKQGEFYNVLTGKGQISSSELVKSRLYMWPFFSKNNLHMLLFYPYNAWLGEDVLIHTSGFTFPDSTQQPFIDRDINWKFSFLGPYQTYIRNMKHVENPATFSGQWPAEKSFLKNSKGKFTFPLFYMYNPGYHLALEKVYGYTDYDNYYLRKTPFGLYKLTGRSDMSVGNHPEDNYFFFEDDKNTFFVRKPGVGLTNDEDTSIVSIGDAGSTSGFSTFSGAVNASNTFYSTDEGVMNGNATVSAYNPKGEYFFQTFYHPHVKEFVKTLNKYGIGELMKLEKQVQADTMGFALNYEPNPWVVMNEASVYKHPENKVDFDYWGTYSGYNWELFFHVPMLLAQRLSNNQRFEEAQKWYHYIFNPTSNTGADGQPTPGVQRFWRFRPFYDKAMQTVETLADIIDKLSQNNAEAVLQLNTWMDNPFKPHAIARIRTLAYMKNVVMKYLDNLIAWADQLFRRDTMESLNEATNLYILAANILGQRPQEIPPRAFSAPHSFDELASGGIDSFSNALVKLESYIDPHTFKGGMANASGGAVKGIPQIAYFCLPKNEKLVGYWDTVADRLFKIRNCMNIEGQKRSLPLFEPPIDPALLVKAAAAGVDMNSLLDAVNGDGPHYRFGYMLQKSNELCGDVKALGGALLSALEKKDAEVLSALRSTHEIAVLERVRGVKETQIAEAEANIEALRKTKENVRARFTYYNNRPYMNAMEKEAMKRQEIGLVLQAVSGAMSSVGSGLAGIPQFHAQVTAATGASFGGQHLGSIFQGISAAIGVAANINSARGSMASTIGGYDRRMDDWKFQAETATLEEAQIDKQIIAADIRRQIALKELENHDKQIENAQAVDEYMRSKYTNTQLYNWMIGQISTVYFQAYQLAYDIAKKTESCYDRELPLGKKATGGYIQFGYWDSLKKGLLTGEKLQLDLRQLEIAYIESNERELELTKNISLLFSNPEALMTLRQEGKCQFALNEELFDMDFPGHYFRRLKSVSLTIPCITGPYTTVNATLSMQRSATRKSPLLSGSLGVDSDTSTPSIATSSAQNDNGMFELNFRDERYLPFEGRGAVSEWELTLADEDQLRLFDFSTISDVIVQVKYTARADGALKLDVIDHVNGLLSTGASTYYGTEGFTDLKLPRYFTLKHEYSSEWYKYTTNHEMDVTWSHDVFPALCKGKTIEITEFYVKAVPKTGVTGVYRISEAGGTTISLSPNFEGTQSLSSNISIQPNGEDSSVDLTFKVQKQNGAGWDDIDLDDIFDDIYLVAYYTI